MTDSDDTGAPDGPVLVVGSGLVGTSVALALRRHDVEVYLDDADPTALRVAASIGAGKAAPANFQPALVVVAVPPAELSRVVADSLGRWPAAVVTDVGSIKVGPLDAVRARTGAGVRRYVGGHPMAGSERSGPVAATPELFDGRAWAVTAHAEAEPAAVEQVEQLVAACGAVLVRMTPDEHDTAVARISHLPHVLSALAAARLVGAPEDHLALAGQGLRDVTRVAGGDPGLWQQILEGNAEAVANLLQEVRHDLEELIADLSAQPPRLLPLLTRGVEGTRAIPGKHGGPVRTVAPVFVVIPDRPGQLATLFADAGEAGINIEDVRIDHDPGRPAGLVEISVTDAVADRLVAALGERGWVAHR